MNVSRWPFIFRLLCCTAVAMLPLSTPAAFAEDVGTQKEAEADVVVEEVVEAGAPQSDQDKVNTANNPLADLMSVSIHNYYYPRLNGIPDASANTFWLRVVTPVWRLIPRVSLPIQVVPAPNPTASVATVTGVGDLNVFATFVVTPDDSPAMLGLGPIYTAPTASNDALGNGKHEIGLAALTVWTKGIFLLGALVNYQIGVGGDSNKPRTQFISAQPLAFFQLGKGFYLRAAPIWFFDLEQPTYNVPFGLGAGKVILTDKAAINLFIEPQFAMALRGIGQPAVQIFAGINTQFEPGARKKKNRKSSDEAAHLVNQLKAEHALRSRMQ
ncbi:MAG: hypothetical protein HKN10_04110 [Myxococcales bacterium]|nr:hypothetical protein [Deltaproteobacteria bacterium]NNE17644.1 hypothetical protein [Myxococcales bacterium]